MKFEIFLLPRLGPEGRWRPSVLLEEKINIRGVWRGILCVLYRICIGIYSLEEYSSQGCQAWEHYSRLKRLPSFNWYKHSSLFCWLSFRIKCYSNSIVVTERHHCMEWKTFSSSIPLTILPFTAHWLLLLYNQLSFSRFWCGVRTASRHRGRTYVSISKWDEAISRTWGVLQEVNCHCREYEQRIDGWGWVGLRSGVGWEWSVVFKFSQK